jgi:methionyl-tRNA synthetase
MVDTIKGFNWLAYYGGKFSTSRRRGVFMDQALEKLPADYWRYWLIANAPESDDTDFTFELFAGGCNKDLADTFGNFVNRCLKFAASRFDGLVPAGGEPGADEAALVDELDRRIAAYRDHLERIEFRKALAELRAIWVRGNEYLQHAAPWKVIKTDRDQAAMIVRTGVQLVRLFAALSWPVIPESAERVLAALGEPAGMPSWPGGGTAAELAALEPGRPLGDPGILFRKLPPEEVAALAAEFRGESVNGPAA